MDMYRYKRSLDDKGRRKAKILPLNAVTKSPQLVPWFGENRRAPRHLTCENVMEEWPEFLINSFTDDFTYQSVY